jgi:fatty acid desaturase
MRRYAAVIDAPVRVATLGEPSGDDPSMGSSRRAAVAGASVGVAATLGMSAVMMAGQRFGLTGRHPPEEIVDRSAERLTGHRLEEQHADAAGAIAHLAFGAAAGAMFAIGWGKLHPAIPASLAGVGYATGIWSASYLGWVPALGLMPPAEQDDRSRQTVLLVAHWVYGVILGTVVERLTQSEEGPRLGLR